LGTRWAIFGVILGIGCGFVSTASATDVGDGDSIGNIDNAIEVAIEAVRDGRCDEAYQALAPIEGLEDRARLLSGQCRVRAGLYPEALVDLDRARDGDELDSTQRGDVELYRGVALYHLERFPEASAALDKADGRTGAEGELALYQGLLTLRSGENEGAALSLESAARISPDTTEPVASYYAGLAWHGASERTKARAAFKRVVDLDGDGPWGKEATKMLESMARFPYFVRGSVGIEYDDNVILAGGVTQFSNAGSAFGNGKGQKDWRGVWSLDAGVQLFSLDDYSGGITGGYTGDAHYDLADFNTHYPTIGAYLAHQFDANTTGQIRYEYGFAWVDEDSFLSAHTVEVAGAHEWPKAGTTIVLADVISNDLRFSPRDVQPEGAIPGAPCVSPVGGGCGPVGLNEQTERDRDGIGVGAAVEHHYPIPLPAAVVDVLKEVETNLGYRFRYYDSRGDEWKYSAHILTAGVEFEFPLDFSLSTRVSYEYRDFKNPSTFPDNETADQVYGLSGVDREEHEVNFAAEIEKDLSKNLSVSARWSYLDNESNRRVYDYTRHIVGGYVNFRFD
jgi:tetratricopeptide (TPR) repeat protein